MSLKSDLLKQARFGGRLLVWGPPVDYVARLDGATKYWQLSDPIVIPAEADCSITFTLNGSLDTYEGLFRSSDNSDWFRLIPDSQSNNFQGNVGGSYIGGVPYSSLKVRNGSDRKVVLRRVENRFYIDIDGNSYTLSVASGEFSISVLGEFGGGEFFGYFKDLEVEINDVLTNKIPLTNRFQGATQLATVGNVNATMINYTGDEWEVVAPKPAINYVARVDGATQYWQLSGPITAPASTDFTYSAYISGTRTSDIEGIFSDSGGSAWLRALDTGQSQDLQMFIGGSFKGKSYPVGYDLRDGNFNLFKLSRVGGQLSFSINDSGMQSLGTSNAEFSIDNLFRFSNQYFAGVIYGLEVDIGGVLTNSIPLTNKEQGATQLSTVGSVNATMINYTGDEWEVVEPAPTINYVARLDGATKYWQLSAPIQLDVSGFALEFDYYVTTEDTSNGLFSGDNALSEFSAYERIGSGRLSTFYYKTASGTLNSTLLGKVVDGDVGLKTFRFEKTGNDLTVTAGNKAITVSSNEFTDDFILRFIGKAASLYSLGYFKNFRVYNSSGNLTNEIPLTNKAQGATQLATVGSVNATMINYTGDEWETL